METIPEDKKKKKKKNITQASGRRFVNVIAGDVISNINFEKHIFFILFVIFLTIIYIGNGYQAYTISNENHKLRKEIKELRASYVSSQARLIEKMKFTSVQEEIEKQNLELKELSKPPYTISTDGY
ncbi:MAG: FtsL-like putative cell division protein [Bacteroidales bacterium]|jgi:cell division protein FtsL|nr:FtsL-like putative cell division protein [Bacteroidales bacterium]